MLKSNGKKRCGWLSALATASAEMIRGIPVASRFVAKKAQRVGFAVAVFANDDHPALCSLLSGEDGRHSLQVIAYCEPTDLFLGWKP